MELKHKLTEIVKFSAAFEYYKNGQLYYSVVVDREHKYTFPVDLVTRTVIKEADEEAGTPAEIEIKMSEDIGEARFDDFYAKSITLMRYINKAIKNDELRYEFVDISPPKDI